MLFDNSRYVNSDTYYDKNNIILFENREIKTFNESKCSIYQVIIGDSLDSISYKFYGKACYFWAILDCNPKYASEIDIEIGDFLLIPNKEEILDFYDN